MSADPIKLALLDWTGQLTTAPVLGEVLRKAGHAIAIIADRLLSAAASNQQPCLGLEFRP